MRLDKTGLFGTQKKDFSCNIVVMLLGHDALSLFTRLMVALWCLCVHNSAFADTWVDPQTGILWTYSVNGNEVSVGGGESDHPAVIRQMVGTVTIPSSIAGLPVTGIADYAFYECDKMTSVNIPTSVTTIGYCAFVGCDGLETIYIPSRVTHIGDHAFRDCLNLTTITIPVGVDRVGDLMFYRCSGLTSVTLPSSVTSIGESAFYGCYRLKSVDMPSSVITIGDSAFRGCSGLTSLIIPASVSSIGACVFSDCEGLTTVSILNCGPGISNRAFENCCNLTSVTIPEGVSWIGGSAFDGCHSLTSVMIPSSVLSIGDNAFDGCGLESVTIPSNVETIGSSAFSECLGLTSIMIPTNVISIGDWAFSGCKGLTSVAILNPEIEIGQKAFSGCDNVQNATVPGWRCTIPFSSVTNLVVSDGAKRISSALGCASLISLKIPTSVIEVGYNAFSDYVCTSIKSIEAPSMELVKGSSGRSVVEFKISAGTTRIRDMEGYGLDKVKAVYIPSSVIELGSSIFGNGNEGNKRCPCLEKFVVEPGGLCSTMGDGVLYANGSVLVRYPPARIGPYTIPQQVTSIESNAFYGCDPDIVFSFPGFPPLGLAGSGITSSHKIQYNSEHASAWLPIIESIGFVNATPYVPQVTKKTVTFDLGEFGMRTGGGELIQDVDYGAAAIAPTVDARTGWRFVGWDSFFYNVTEDMTVTARYEVDSSVRQCVVRFDANGGVVSESSRYVEKGAIVGELPIPTRDKYAFRGWYTAVDGGTAISAATIVETVEMTCYARWESISLILWEDPTTGLVWNYTAENGEASVGCGEKWWVPAGAFTAINTTTAGLISIPSWIEQYPVTRVGGWAFSGCSKLSDIRIPHGVESIGCQAFCGCSGLTNIVIPSSVVNIGKGAFSGCTSLKRVEFPSGLTCIDESVCSGCSGMTSATIPLGVTSIGAGAFAGCSGLTNITISPSVFSIGEQAFRKCIGLDSITIPASVSSIGDTAFDDCSDGMTLYFEGAPPSFTGNSVGRIYIFDNPIRYNSEFATQWRIAITAWGFTQALPYDVAHTVTFDLHTVTFDLGEHGTRTDGVPLIQSVKHGEMAVAPTLEVAKGYTFLGWDKTFDNVTGSMTVTANYGKTSYVITYVDTKGCVNTNPTEYTVEDAVSFVALTAPVGWRFLGWSPSTIAKGSTGEKAVTAQWEEQGGGDTPEQPPVNPPEVQSHAVTFDLGPYGTWTGGGTLVQSVKHGGVAVAPTFEVAAGYAFVGWDKTFDYVESKMEVAARYETIPYAITYVLDGGANAVENPGSYTVEDAVTLAVPTRDGYVFTGWTPNDGMIANGSTGDKTFTAQWEKVRNEVVDEVEPIEATEFVATTYDGYLYREEDGVVVGTVQVKAAKPKKDKKSGKTTTKLTIAVQMAGESKKVSISGDYDLAAGGEQSFAKSGRTIALLLGENGMTGSFEGCVIEGVPNVFGLKDAESKAKAAEADAAYVGTYNLIADEGTFSLTIAKKGKVKVSGTMATGKKVSVSTLLLVGNGVACAPVIAPKAGIAFTLWIENAVLVDGLTDALVGKAGTLAAGSLLMMDATGLSELIGDDSYAAYFPDGIAVVRSGTKWIVAPDAKGKAAKAGKVVLGKDGAVDETKLGENPSALKLTYTAKTGSFKGSFKAYVNSKGKPKAVTVSVSGVMIGDCAYGTAIVNKGSVPIAISAEK